MVRSRVTDKYPHEATTMTRSLPPLFLALAWLSFSSCAWGATTMSYPMKEAAIAAGNKGIVWLDNTHVVFHGATGGEGSPGHESPVTNRGTYVWDLDRGTATREPRFDHAGRICVQDDYVLYSVPAEDNKSTKRVAFLNGQQIELPQGVWINSMSCRPSLTQPPSWVVDGHTSTSKVPLLEEHGYIDRGIDGQDRTNNFPLLYYRPGAAQPIPLGLGSQQVDPHVRYYPFMDAYLLEDNRSAHYAPPLWLLHPSGTVEQIFTPEGQAWAKLSWPWLEVTKRGPVFASLHLRGPHSADAGLYLWAGGVLTRVAEGFFDWGAASPDGCKLAVIKSRPERPLPPVEMHRLQIIDLCQGDQVAPSPQE